MRLPRRDTEQEPKPEVESPSAAVTGAVELPLGAGVGVPGEGGPHLLADSLAEYRWLAQHEAVTLANSDLDPLAWPDGQMGFAFERYLAHGHEALRDRVANAVAARLRDEVRVLYGIAGSIASVRDGLTSADTDLARATRAHRTLADEVGDDPVELARFHRQRSEPARFVKTAILVTLVLMEMIVSGRLFEAALRLDFPGLGFVFAGGLTLLLIVLPHYAAAGLKDAVAQRRTAGASSDARGLLVGAGLVLLLLAGLLVPLSRLRAEHAGGGDDLWFWFYLTLQAGISGYFFLREWLDHSTAAHNLHDLEQALAVAEEHRDGLFDELTALVTEFHETAEDLILTLREGPRWDDHVVEAYHETLEGFRHTLVAQRGELAPFLYWARTPTLGGRAGRGAAEHTAPLEPISGLNGRLDEASPLGRDFWMDALAGAVTGLPAPDRAAGDASWLYAKSPHRLLEEFLQRFFGLEARYRRPPEADPEPALSPDGSENPPATNGHRDRRIAMRGLQ